MLKSWPIARAMFNDEAISRPVYAYIYRSHRLNCLSTLKSGGTKPPVCCRLHTAKVSPAGIL